jgi:hypothetical protein
MQHEQLVFIAREYPKIPHTYVDANRVGTMHLPHLNYNAHLWALSGDEVDPWTLLKEWFLAGVMMLYPDNEQVPDNEPERVINLMLHGHHLLSNIWGAVKRGDYLSLAIIEEEITPETRYVTDLVGFAVQKPGIRGKNGIVKTVPRIVPIVHKSRFVVAPKDLIYFKDCQPVIAETIYVGRVVHNDRYKPGMDNSCARPDTRINDNPCVNMRALIDCTRIWVHMNCSY